MNKVPLLEIEPKELTFIFELKKQISCSVQLTNNTYNYVAFKVKTTSPKKYSVRPNVGVLMPKSTCEFIVTMQAQQEAPIYMVCKDKFLIQSTIVPVETTDKDVTSSLFVKDDSRYVEENKLKVALISPPESPELSPINGDFKNGHGHEHENDQICSRDEILSPEPMVVKNAEHNMVTEELKHEDYMELKPEHMGLDTIKDAGELEPEVVEEMKPEKEAESKVSIDVELNMVKDAEELKLQKEAELKVSNGIEELKLMEAIEEMKLKLDELESKLTEAGVTISKLTEERRLSNQETKFLQEKLADLIDRGPRKVQVGFPLLYVCMVALICVVFGYRLQS